MQSKRPFPLLVVLLAICLVYGNSFSNGFHFDDYHAITDNPAVRSLGNLHRIFTDATAFSVLPANQTYRPVVTASLALDYALGHGYVPFWFHLSTMLWFLLLVALLYFFSEIVFVRSAAGDNGRWLALAVAAWFGLHPVMAETVNYIIQRGDLYCTLGCVAALYVFARWSHLRRYGLYLLPYVFAMLSKPPSAVLPVLLVLYAGMFENEQAEAGARWRAALLDGVPAAGVTAGLLWLQAEFTPKSFLPSTLSAADYRWTQPYVFLRYFVALFLPLHLNVDTDLQPFHGVSGRALLGVCFVLCVLVIAVLTARQRRTRPIAFGLLWFVVTQLPTALYPLSEVENDHRMFFSFPGLMIAVVWAAYLGYERAVVARALAPARLRAVHWTIAGVAAAVLCGYAYGAHRRNEVWHSEDSLWADDVLKSPHNGRGLMIYGLTRMNGGDYAEALSLFERALIYTPNYPTLEINLGVVSSLMAAKGDRAMGGAAERHFTRAITLAPADDTTHAFFGRWLLDQGRLDQATRQLELAVSLNPQRPMQRDLLLKAYVQAGNVDAARRLATETLAMVPGDAAAQALLAGHTEAAQPRSSAALINQSLAAYRTGRYEESVQEAQAALRLDPKSAEAWNNVGAAYGAMHKWDAAIDAEEKALNLNPQLQIAANNLRWFQAEKSGKHDTHAEVARLIDLSLMLNQQGRLDESLSAAQAAAALDPQSAEAWNNIAADQEAMRHWNEAIRAAQKAIAIRPDFQLAKNNLQWSLQQKAAGVKP